MATAKELTGVITEVGPIAGSLITWNDNTLTKGIDKKMTRTSFLTWLKNAVIGPAATMGIMKQPFINPDMLVRQRVIADGAAVASGDYLIDGWKGFNSSFDVDFRYSVDYGDAQPPPLGKNAGRIGLINVDSNLSGTMTIFQSVPNSRSDFIAGIWTYQYLVRSNSANVLVLGFDEFGNEVISNSHTGGSDWELLTLTIDHGSGAPNLPAVGYQDAVGDPVTINLNDFFDVTLVKAAPEGSPVSRNPRTPSAESLMCAKEYIKYEWVDHQTLIGRGYALTVDRVDIAVPTGLTMESPVTVSIENIDRLQNLDGTAVVLNGTEVVADEVVMVGAVVFSFTKVAAFNIGDVYTFRLNAADDRIVIDAGL